MGVVMSFSGALEKVESVALSTNKRPAESGIKKERPYPNSTGDTAFLYY